MKGIVFSELFELVEKSAGYEVVDRIIDKADLPNDGAYTAVGTYDFAELASLVGHLSEELDKPFDELVKLFGRHLFVQFSNKFPQLCEYNDAFSLLKDVESIIHVEVHKLYANAELPSFEYEQTEEHVLHMTYQSKRPLADLCEGLIERCIEHFGEPISLSREDLTPDRTRSRFTLTKSTK